MDWSVLLFFLKPLLLTIFIEVGIAVLFLGVRDKLSFYVLTLTQVVTNVPLNILVAYARDLGVFNHINEFVIIFLLEVVVVLVEGFIYHKFKIFEHPWLVSLLLNWFSYFLGTLLYMFVF